MNSASRACRYLLVSPGTAAVAGWGLGSRAGSAACSHDPARSSPPNLPALDYRSPTKQQMMILMPKSTYFSTEHLRFNKKKRFSQINLHKYTIWAIILLTATAPV